MRIIRVRLGLEGYYGEDIWGYSPKEKARIFEKMKDARRVLNRVRDRFHFSKAEIEIEEKHD